MWYLRYWPIPIVFTFSKHFGKKKCTLLTSKTFCRFTLGGSFLESYLDPNKWPHLSPFLSGLKKNGLSPEKIQYCVCTHGHSDHVGNLSLFDKAVHILSYDVCTGDKYHNHDFKTVCCFQLFGIILSLFNLIHSLIKLLELSNADFDRNGIILSMLDLQ